MNKETYLQHFGIPGMKWGRRKVAQWKTDQAVKDERRGKVFNKSILTNPSAMKTYNKIINGRGKSSANRILDIMSKHPSKSFKSAVRQQRGEYIATRALAVVGSIAISKAMYSYANKRIEATSKIKSYKIKNNKSSKSFDEAIKRAQDYNRNLKNAVDKFDLWNKNRFGI